MGRHRSVVLLNCRCRGRILEVPKLLDHIRATGALNDSSRMIGVSWCRGLWRHIGSARTLKTRVVQSRGSNNAEVDGISATQRQCLHSAEQQQRKALEGQCRLAAEGASVSRYTQIDLYVRILGCFFSCLLLIN